MGSSPSKGKFFSKQAGSGAQNVPLDEPSKDNNNPEPEEKVTACLQTTEEDNELPQPAEENSTENRWCHLASDTTDQNILDTEEAVVNETSGTGNVEGQTDKEGEENEEMNERKRSLTEKQRKPSILQKKLDFQPQLVRAHQAAYDLLNSNLPKYETLLDLLNQAARTQLSFQSMMSALVQNFEEINQALEEMAEQGESMLKEHGDNMALTPLIVFLKHDKDTVSYPDPSPILLQRLLKHSTEKTRQVAASVQTLGDTRLEEAAEHFTSLSKLMVKEHRAKRDAEQRLTHVLAQIELATMKSFNPEDWTLHSEDSGIGGENESLTGSDRHRSDRESAGSASLGSIVNIHTALFSPPNNGYSLFAQNEYDEEDEKGGDDNDDKEFEDTESGRLGRKRSNSLPHYHIHANDTKNGQPTVRQPKESQKIFSEQLKIRGNKSLVGPPHKVLKTGLRRHSLSALVDAQKDSRIVQSPVCLPMIAPHPPRPKSVRTLINTFSQGGQGTALPSIRRNRKQVILCLPDTNGKDGCSVINGNNNNNSWPDVKDDMDVDNLPPPPPEVLLDNSFQSTEGTPNNVKGALENVDQISPTNQRPGVTQRLKASMQNVEVLPNRSDLRRNFARILPGIPVGQHAGRQDMEQPDNEPNKKCFYQQSYKTLEHYNEAESVDRSNTEELSGQRPSPHPPPMDQMFESKQGCYGGGTSSVTAPPVSRVRLPPYCPTTCHSFLNQPVCRPPTATMPASRPSSPRTVIRAVDDDTEKIIPSVSFHSARSVFCLNNPQNHQTEPHRGRITTRAFDSSGRRTKSEQRPSQTSHQGFPKDGS